MEKILNMFVVPFRLKEPLSYEDINAIRYHYILKCGLVRNLNLLYRIKTSYYCLFMIIKTMDLHQENLAKQIGDKNLLIRGVAGSGKTLILAGRAKMLSKEHPDWKILILCYNISLANGIQQMVTHMLNEPEDLFDFDFTNNSVEVPKDNKNVIVRNFHSWLKNDLKIREQQIPTMISKLENNEAIFLPKYDAILIDEGQDFESDWLRLVSLLINKETQSFLLVEDRAQTIYKRKRSYTRYRFKLQGQVSNSID
ncbi:AAA family ATPase [Niallia sp. XMNu-256]|uniref:UvrD-helicase domain-containing protein n=1 Tax=Niallia sp. XMNu-256 TaxID=3082444 RepID=UPI0030CB2A7B